MRGTETGVQGIEKATESNRVSARQSDGCRGYREGERRNRLRE